LRDGTRAGVGDWIVTRTNNRRLPVGAHGDFVENGDTWQVTGHDQRGGLRVAHLSHGGTVHLPAAYVTAHVQLGYASTVHRVQGTTVDTAHAVITPHATRESLYVAASRARQRTDLYVATEDVDLTAGEHPPTTTNPDARDLLTRTLAFPANQLLRYGNDPRLAQRATLSRGHQVDQTVACADATVARRAPSTSESPSRTWPLTRSCPGSRGC